MIRKLLFTLKLNNSGSTMVEVLMGFIILSVVLSQCLVHMVNFSSEMVEKSADVLREQSELNEEMYKKNADFKIVCGTRDGGATDNELTFTLTVNEEKTHMELNGATSASFTLPSARLQRFEWEKAGLNVYRFVFDGEAGGP